MARSSYFLSPEEIARIKELRRAGKSTPEISAAVGVGENTVRRHSPPPPRSVDAELVYQMSAENKSAAQIAKAVNRSKRTIQRLLSNRPEKRGYQPPYPDSMREKARIMLEDRAGYAETARTLGVYPKTVAGWFPGMGLTPAEIHERRTMMRKYGGVV